MHTTHTPSIANCLLILIVGMQLNANAALGAPCQGKTVITGDTPEEVTAKCGEAALKEHRVVLIEETDRSGTRRITTTIDEWTYDFGPEELMPLYRFENGKLADSRIVGYGRLRDINQDTCRNGQLLAVGDSTVDAYIKCGEPLAREKQDDKSTETIEGETKRRTTVPVVEWTYRYGPNMPGYTLRFENGIVTDIRTREFGK